MMIYESVAVTLSIAGNEPQSFAGQTVELDREPETVVMSVDGKMSVGYHPWTIIWHGKSADDLKVQFINVKIVRNDGSMLVNGPINRNFEAPCNVSKGVQFQI
jgi:hypothetical protein